jgi:hypothetical protein
MKRLFRRADMPGLIDVPDPWLSKTGSEQNSLAFTPVAEAKQRARIWKFNVSVAVHRFEDHVDPSTFARAGPDRESYSSART